MNDGPVAIAFDLDGLMFNTEELYIQVARQMLARRGHELEMELIHAMMGLPAEAAFPVMIRWYDLPDTVDELARETDQLFDSLLPNALTPMPGLLDLLRHVDARGLPKAITTSSSRSYVDRVLRLAPLPTEFEFWLTSEDVQQGKPHPEIYLQAAARFDVNTDRMLVLEDSQNGCRAAVAAGAFTVAVPAAHNAGSDYQGARLVADSLDDPRLLQIFA